MPNTQTVDTLKKDPQHDRLTMAMTDLTRALPDKVCHSDIWSIPSVYEVFSPFSHRILDKPVADH